MPVPIWYNSQLFKATGDPLMQYEIKGTDTFCFHYILANEPSSQWGGLTYVSI
jgi:hypothetical protein